MTVLASAAAVLKLFTKDRQELSVTEAARLLGIPKSSASRLLKAMLNEALLVHAGDTPRYRVGHLVFEASRAYYGTSPLVDLADSELLAISRDTGHTSYICMIEGEDVLVLRVHLGTRPLLVVTPHGSRRRAFATSTGRAMLVRCDRDHILSLKLTQARSAKSPRTHEALERALADIRRRGWAEAEDEEIPGVSSVAVSIADPRRSEMLALCIVCPAQTTTRRERDRHAALLVAAARRIAAQVDDRFWTERHPLKIVAA